MLGPQPRVPGPSGYRCTPAGHVRLCEVRGSPTQLVTSPFPTPQTRPMGRPLWLDLISFPLSTWPLPSNQPSPGPHLCPPQGIPRPLCHLSTSCPALGPESLLPPPGGPHPDVLPAGSPPAWPCSVVLWSLPLRVRSIHGPLLSHAILTPTSWPCCFGLYKDLLPCLSPPLPSPVHLLRGRLAASMHPTSACGGPQ